MEPNELDRKSTNRTPTGVIDGSRLGETPYAIPEPKVSTNNLTNLSFQSSPFGVTRDEAAGKITSLTSDLADKSGRSFEIQEDEGVFDAREDYDRVQNEIRDLENNYNRTKERIQTTGGGLEIGSNSEMRNITREFETRRTDQLIAAEILGGNYDRAFSRAQAKIDAEFEPIQDAIDNYTRVYQLMADDLTESEKLQIEANKEQKQFERDTLYDAKSSATQMLIESGAYTPERANQISRASTPDQVNASMTGVQSLAQQQLANSRSSSTSVSSSIQAVADAGLLGSSDDPMLDIISASAGGRQLTQSEAEPLTNAQRVVSQLKAITDSDISSNTGPILGIIRSNNPYDVKAQELRASITALVPQLARGIYGEVGVLTDSDVDRYIQTLPNMRSTDEVNQAVLGLTLRNVRSAFASQLESMAAAGRDVSGYINIYNNMTDQINSIEESIGIGSMDETSLDDEFDSFNQDSTSSSNAAIDDPMNRAMGGGFNPFKSLGRLLFGE